MSGLKLFNVTITVSGSVDLPILAYSHAEAADIAEEIDGEDYVTLESEVSRLEQMRGTSPPRGWSPLGEVRTSQGPVPLADALAAHKETLRVEELERRQMHLPLSSPPSSKKKAPT